jgi:hypothetical protein
MNRVYAVGQSVRTGVYSYLDAFTKFGALAFLVVLGLIWTFNNFAITQSWEKETISADFSCSIRDINRDATVTVDCGAEGTERLDVGQTFLVALIHGQHLGATCWITTRQPSGDKSLHCGLTAHD